MITKIINGKLITDRVVEGKSLYIQDGIIADITEKDLPVDSVIDADSHYVSPGFIDIHTHGGGGYDFMDGTDSALRAARFHFAHGTTTLFATTASSSVGVLKEAIAGIKAAMACQGTNTARIYGVHLEGPYFSLNQKGAQNPSYITPPQKADYTEIIRVFGDVIKRWSFAPELDGSEEFCKTLCANGIVPSIAHSDATYEEVKRVYDCGCRLVTHLYSATSTITRVNGYRKLGIIESAYLLDDMLVEVIADGCHLPPELLKMIYKIKGPDNTCLVTDSMRGAGMPEGPSVIGSNQDGLPCIIEGGVAKMPNRSGFAGSVATTDRLVRTMIKDAGVDIVNAVKMMTEIPAKTMRIRNKGVLRKGFDADILIFDDDIKIKQIIQKSECGSVCSHSVWCG